MQKSMHCRRFTLLVFILLRLLVTSAEEGSYVFTSVCLSVRQITEKVVNGF